MKKSLFAVVAMAFAGSAFAATVQDIAERYTKLVLAIGVHDPAYVDAYYGPPQLQEQVTKERQGLPAIRAQIALALKELAPQRPANADEALRIAFLTKQLQSMLTRIDMLSGKKFKFDEESRQLYDAVSPHHERAYYQRIVRQIDQMLPGSGTVSERLAAYRSKFVIPKDKLKPVFDAAIKACRERTARYITLPANENFALEFVTNKPWSGYNWYKGNSQSLIQINTEFPIYVDRAVDLGCHEGYPGHHAYNALLEKTLVNDRKWTEFRVYPLYSPMSLIAEGSANYGIDMAFTDAERLAFEKTVLFPMAGIDPALADQYAQLRKLTAKLSYADNDAAMHYLEGKWNKEQTIEWLVNVQLYPPEKAAQRVSFYDANRSYVINYNLGADLVKAYIERHSTSKDPETARAQRWAAFKQLLSSPRLASGLR
ncbi:hypothetical protein KY495_14040 [Massilia sp. PAMC28688]|uniref:hypothetical protein n=1 Tax=Massilia sp. PAMC28688 TaxID=2861283 RepID=UPI001C62E311|nr:hypothetical protein [Massilia sp. PAMC28688]QYF91903.1 hypothetical protein KY495_14040 [Massilia sp. PAMC28688]